jgi:drug/metabolite transporter (DMT)-like permease
MQTERKAGAGLLLAVLSAGTFGTSGAFASSLIGAGWSPGAAVAARVSAAALMLAIPALFMMRGRWHIARRNLGVLALYGLIAVAGCQVLYFNALAHLSVGVALMIEYLGVLGVVGWMWAAHGHRPRRLTIIGSVVAIAGLALVLDLFGDNHLDPIGVLWAVAAAAALGVYFVLSSHIDPELPPIALASTGMAFGAVVLWVFGFVGIIPLHRGANTVDFAGHRTSWLVPILGLSLVAAVIAYAAGITAARLLGPKLASFIAMTEVIFAVIFAWLLLDQLPTPIQIVGGAFIVAGVAFVRLDELKPDESRAVVTNEAALAQAA